MDKYEIGRSIGHGYQLSNTAHLAKFSYASINNKISSMLLKNSECLMMIALRKSDKVFKIN
jgi:hypothetical protein